MSDGSSTRSRQTEAASFGRAQSADRNAPETSSSRPLLRFETGAAHVAHPELLRMACCKGMLKPAVCDAHGSTPFAESCSDSETANGRNSGHYGFPGDASQESQPDRRNATQQQQQHHRLGRFLSGGMSSADRAAASEQLAQHSGSGAAGGEQHPQPSAAHPPQQQHSRLASLRLPPRGPAAISGGPAADAAAAATAAAAPIVAAAAAAAAAGNVAAGRVYHALYRGAPRSNASASGAQTPDLAEPLVPGQVGARCAG